MNEMKSVSLNGKWVLIQNERNIKIEAEVPGSVYEALIGEKLIEDPFYGLNEHDMAWIYNNDWFYEKTFSVDELLLKNKNIILQFAGIDTIAEIYLNEELLGISENMFRTYEFDVKDKLAISDNRLRVVIKSPTEKAKEEMEKFGIPLTTGSALPYVPFLRKAQYSFGWDWGPWLPDIGIWKDVTIIGYNDIKIDSIYPLQTLKYNKDPLTVINTDEISSLRVESVLIDVNIELNSDLENLNNSGYTVQIEFSDAGNTILMKKISVEDLKVTANFKIDNPKLWWTHDLGEPVLYDIGVSLVKNNIIHKISQKIGIRDIRLIRSPDKWGESFYFMLNGIPIFAKGANWIPVDSFIPRGKKLGLYQKNLGFAKEANMNMIRVWGGGIYEDDLFYELCDELGILVWQDFPFACAIYNFDNEEFVESIKTEAVQNIKRIRNHPSLGLWCGNNEIEQLWNMALIQSGLIDMDDPKKLLNPEAVSSLVKGYQKMFEEILPDLIKQLDKIHSYWPSSPSNGIGKQKGTVRSNSPDEGDSHFWTVWHGRAPFQEFRKFDSRFMSEFGFESFPSLKTVKTFCPSEQLDIYSKIMENHQKNRAGNKLIMDYMDRRFSVPDKFESRLILSQITHGEAMEYGIEHWRRNRNEQHCMGSLYWQLNDCWPVASWASLDYYGRWKALHYFAKRAYQPIFASVKEEPENCEIWITNSLKIRKNGELSWLILESNGKTVDSGRIKVEIPACFSSLAKKIDMTVYDYANIDQIAIFFTLEVREVDEQKVFHGFRLFGAPKDFTLEEPNLTCNFSKLDKKSDNNWEYIVKIHTESTALYVHLRSETSDFIYLDNFFSMPPNSERIIKFRRTEANNYESNLTIEDLENQIKIASLFNLIPR